MFEGLGFRILSLIVTFLSIGVAVIGGLMGLVALYSDDGKVTSVRVSYPLCTLILFVVVQVAVLEVMWRLPYEVAQRPILGMRMVTFVWSFFQLATLALCFATWSLARKAPGPTASILRRTSTLLLTIWGLGFIWYLVGE